MKEGKRGRRKTGRDVRWHNDIATSKHLTDGSINVQSISPKKVQQVRSCPTECKVGK